MATLRHPWRALAVVPFLGALLPGLALSSAAGAAARLGPPECVVTEMHVWYGGTPIPSMVADGAGQRWSYFYFDSRDNCTLTNWYPHFQLVRGDHRSRVGYGTPRRRGEKPVFVMLRGVRLVAALTERWGAGGPRCRTVQATGVEIFGAYRSDHGHRYVYLKLPRGIPACLAAPNGRASPFRRVS